MNRYLSRPIGKKGALFQATLETVSSLDLHYPSERPIKGRHYVC